MYPKRYSRERIKRFGKGHGYARNCFQIAVEARKQSVKGYLPSPSVVIPDQENPPLTVLPEPPDCHQHTGDRVIAACSHAVHNGNETTANQTHHGINGQNPAMPRISLVKPRLTRHITV